jgi:hypothetical protein
MACKAADEAHSERFADAPQESFLRFEIVARPTPS